MTGASIAGVAGQVAGPLPGPAQPIVSEPGFAAALQQASAGGQPPAGAPAVPPFDGAGRPVWTTLSGVPVPAWQPDGPPPAGDAAAGGAAAAAPASATSGGDLAARLPAAGKRWAGAITAAARKHRVEPELLAALVRAESNFRHDVRSRAGAIGLAQLMPGTARALGVDPYDPVANLEGGAKYLREQLDRFGRTDLALAAYNAGPHRVSRAGGIPDIAETRAYVPKVLGYYRAYKGTA